MSVFFEPTMVLPAVTVVLLFGLILSGVSGDNLSNFDRRPLGEHRLANSRQTHCRAVRHEPNEKRADQLVRARAARDQRIASSEHVVYLAVRNVIAAVSASSAA
jgi:hypothetical protein